MSAAPLAPLPTVLGVTSGDALGAQHVGDVAALLQRALSQNVSEMQTAQQQMASLADRPGWRACLLQIGVAHDQPELVRTMALTQLKNGLEKLFARRFGPLSAAAPNRDAPEKGLIKQQLLAFHIDGSIGAPTTSERVAGLVSASIAICARHDWPREWDSGALSLFPRLLEALQSPQPLVVLRTLYTLHQVFKALQAARLMLSIQKFQAACRTVLPAVRARWADTQANIHATLAQVLSTNNSAAFSPEVVAHLAAQSKLALLALKCLRMLVSYGVEDVSTNPDTQAFFPLLLEHMQSLVSILLRIVPAPAAAAGAVDASSDDGEEDELAASPLAPFLQPLLAAHVLMFSVCVETIERHPTDFRVFYAPFAQFATQVLQHNAGMMKSAPLQELVSAAAGAKSPTSPPVATDPFVLFPSSTALEPFVIQCLLYLQRVVQKYSRSVPAMALAVTGAAAAASSGSATAGAAAAGANSAAGQKRQLAEKESAERLAALFTPAFTAELLSLLLAHYLVLSRRDMRSWARGGSDAELFYNEERSGCSGGPGGEDGDDGAVLGGGGGGGSSAAAAAAGSGEHALRPTADGLVRVLINHLPELACPALLNLLMHVLQLCPPGAGSPVVSAPQALQAIGAAAAAQQNLLLLKESVYTAVGHAFLHLPALLQSARGISYQTFWQEVLIKELTATSTTTATASATATPGAGNGGGAGGAHPAQKILRRRVAWLLGEWVEALPDGLRPALGQALIQLLHEDDLLLRLAAIDALYRLIDNFPHLGGGEGAGGDTEEDALDLTAAPSSGTGGEQQLHSAGHEALLGLLAANLPAVLGLLFHLLRSQLEELESKRHVLAVLAHVVGALGPRLLSTAALPLLVEHLPRLWEECAAQGQGILRSQLLEVATKLVRALAHRSNALHQPLVLPLLREVMGAAASSNGGGGNNSAASCVESGLDLWLECLHYSVGYSADLASLYPILLAYMFSHTAYLRRCMEISESYVHLGKQNFMNQFAQDIAKIFAGLLRAAQGIRGDVVAANSGGGSSASASAASSVMSSVLSSSGSGLSNSSVDGEGGCVNEEAISLLMAVLETIAQIYPEQTPALFLFTLRFTLKGLLDEANYNALSEEQQRACTVSIPQQQQLTSYLHVLARIFFQNPAGGMQLLTALSTSGAASGSDPSVSLGAPVATLLLCVHDALVRHLDAMEHVYKKKVAVLALIALIGSAAAGVSTAAGCDPLLASLTKKTLACVKRVEKELKQPWAQIEQPEWNDALRTPPEQRIESHRIQLMLAEDPANTLSLRTRFLEQLQQISQRIGPQATQQLIASFNPQVWEECQKGF